jgi:hypothetical protein
MLGRVAPPEKPQNFATTRWSLVVAAGRGDAPEAHAALSTLCGLYWHPCYAFVRRRGYAADPAYDLTQGFFLRLLEKNDLATVDRERGRFRRSEAAAPSTTPSTAPRRRATTAASSPRTT